MSKTSGENKFGRLGNQIFRNIAISILAKKYDLYVDYFNYDLIKSLGINLYVGTKKYKDTIIVSDSNFEDILNCNKLKSNINGDLSFFQTLEISTFIYYYLQDNMNEIIINNEYRDRYNNNNDVFLHVRLSDVSKSNPGANYYLYCLEHLQFDNIYLATDDFNHFIIKIIKEKYPNIKFVFKDTVDTIKFGSTCKYIILSHGTFSCIIGYLSFFSNVYFLSNTPGWCPIDMFLNKGWNAIYKPFNTLF